MTVAELIQKLQAFSPELLVVVPYNSEEGLFSPVSDAIVETYEAEYEWFGYVEPLELGIDITRDGEIVPAVVIWSTDCP